MYGRYNKIIQKIATYSDMISDLRSTTVDEGSYTTVCPEHDGVLFSSGR